MLSDYTWKTVGEVARAVFVAVVAYAAAAISQGGVPTTAQAVISLAVGALPIVYAAIRTAITRSPIPTTPETPPTP